MKTNDLFNSGVSFTEFVNTDTGSYKEKTLEILDTIEFDEEYIKDIENINTNINILVFGEIWCPDCMINIPVIEKMKQYNGNIDVSIVSKEGNEDFLKKYFVKDHVKIPILIVCDEKFKELGIFTEHPKKIKEIIDQGNESKIIVAMRKYRKGEYAQETLKDILDIIGKKHYVSATR